MSTTVKVKPTQRWLGPSKRIPRGRKIERNGQFGEIEVSTEEAQWLTDNFFAVVVNPDSGESSSDQEVSTEDSQEVLTEDSSESPAVVSPDDEAIAPADLDAPEPEAELSSTPEGQTEVQARIVDYLNGTDPETIAQAIKGIGRKTADDLQEKRPLDWEAIAGILTNRQIGELLKHFAQPNG